jgi:hypothetical protein
VQSIEGHASFVQLEKQMALLYIYGATVASKYRAKDERSHTHMIVHSLRIEERVHVAMQELGLGGARIALSASFLFTLGEVSHCTDSMRNSSDFHLVLARRSKKICWASTCFFPGIWLSIPSTKYTTLMVTNVTNERM